MQAIKAMGLVKQYKSLTAVDKLHLEIQQGELFSLLGVNGAGKTTAIKMLSCLSKPTAGDALVGGYSITKQPEQVKRLIGVSPQETAVAPNLSVKENLELICGIHGFSKEKTKAKIHELSDQFALDTVLNRKAGKLSGGWQRRVSIAMALISEPQILFLDEPTLGLDVLARHDLWEVIRSLKGRVTIILTTHYMEEAESLSDHIGIMKGGNFLAVGNVHVSVRHNCIWLKIRLILANLLKVTGNKLCVRHSIQLVKTRKLIVKLMIAESNRIIANLVHQIYNVLALGYSTQRSALNKIAHRHNTYICIGF